MIHNPTNGKADDQEKIYKTSETSDARLPGRVIHGHDTTSRKSPKKIQDNKK